MNIEQNLIEWGLNNKEARVYSSLTERVEATVYRLAQDTKIPRTTVYEILESLVDKGLISFSRKNGIKHFFAESPNRLVRILEEKMVIAKELVPLLFIAPSKTGSEPKVKLYLGEEGKKKVLDDILDTCEQSKQKDFLAIAGTSLPTEVPRYLKKWIERKEKLGLANKMIATDNPGHTPPKIYPNNKWREVRLISSEYISETTIDIYLGKVAIFSKVDGVDHSVIIESYSIYETFKKFFNFMWANSIVSK